MSQDANLPLFATFKVKKHEVWLPPVAKVPLLVTPGSFWTVSVTLVPSSALVPQAYDLSPAKKFGELKVLLPHGSLPIDTEPMISTLQDSLKDFSDDDYLLAIGNPTAMVMAGIIASQNNEKLKMLYWDSKVKDYISVEFTMNK